MESISLQMRRLRPLVALLVLLLYGTTGVLLEVAHRDDPGTPPGTTLSFAAHTCGGHEHHIPLDQWSSCPACIQAALRVSVAASTFRVSPHTALLAVAASDMPKFSPARHLTILPSKRGPPAA